MLFAFQPQQQFPQLIRRDLFICQVSTFLKILFFIKYEPKTHPSFTLLSFILVIYKLVGKIKSKYEIPCINIKRGLKPVVTFFQPVYTVAYSPPRLPAKKKIIHMYITKPDIMFQSGFFFAYIDDVLLKIKIHIHIQAN